MEYYLVEECCKILDSQRIPVTSHKRVKGMYPYYGANGIQDYVDNYIFDGEFVLVAEDGGNFGSKDKPIAYRVSGKCWVNNHAHILKPHDFLDVDYLCFSLMFYNTEGLVNGATRQKLNQAQLRKMKVPKLPLADQRQIVIEINQIISAKSILEKQLNDLDDLVKSRFVEMFGDIANEECKHKICKLYEVAEAGSSHRVFTTEFVDNGIPFYRGTEIGELSIGKIPKTPYRISEEHYKRLADKKTKPIIGDLLMPSICNRGQIWMVDTEEPFYYKDGRVLRISPNKEYLNPRYFLHYMQHKTFIEYQKLDTAPTFSEFKIFLLKDFNVVLPPLTLQNEFAEFARLTDKAKSIIQKQIADLQELRDSKMSEYFG